MCCTFEQGCSRLSDEIKHSAAQFDWAAEITRQKQMNFVTKVL
jgi:hypothetical protein